MADSKSREMHGRLWFSACVPSAELTNAMMRNRRPNGGGFSLVHKNVHAGASRIPPALMLLFFGFTLADLSQMTLALEQLAETGEIVQRAFNRNGCPASYGGS